MLERNIQDLGALVFTAMLAGPALADGSTWTQVQADGFANPANGAAILVEFGGHLFAGTGSFSGGGELWRTADGTSWLQVGSGGFGNPFNDALLAGVEFVGHLYIGTNNPVGGGELWRSSDGLQWSAVAQGGFGLPPNTGVFPVIVFGGALYVTTFSGLGTQVLRSTNGLQWTQVNSNGFGDPGNFGVLCAQEFGGELYLGTLNPFTGGELWKSADGTTWSQVGADGFGDPNTAALFPGASFGGQLYVGSSNAISGGQLFRSPDGVIWTPVGAPGLGDPLLTDVTPAFVRGTELLVTLCGNAPASVWRTTDGVAYTPVTSPGLGDSNNNCAVVREFSGDLYVSMSNFASGVEIWRQHLDALGTTYCSANPNSTGSAAQLALHGVPSLSANCARITATGAPANTDGVFFLGGLRADLPFGDGRMCIGAPQQRIFPAVITSSDGSAGFDLDFTQGYAAAITTVGGTTSYQFWYRDLAAQGSGFNTTAAIEVVHTP